MADFSFKGGMDAALDDAQATFSAGDTLTTTDNRPVPFISISGMTESTKRAYGGTLGEANATISVRKGVITDFAIIKGMILVARGKKVKVLEFDPRLNDSDTLICGPVATAVRP